MDADNMLKGSAVRLQLVMENERLKKELSLLQSLNESRQKQNEELEERARRHDVVVKEMQKELDKKDAVIEGLRSEVEKSVNKLGDA